MAEKKVATLRVLERLLLGLASQGSIERHSADVYDTELPPRVRRDLPPPDDAPLPEAPPPADDSPPPLRYEVTGGE